MNWKTFLSCGALALGILICIAGAGFVLMYISEGIIARLGEPDQSLLFWYLPFLFIGILGIMLGIATAILGFIGVQRHRSSPDQGEREK